MVVIIRTEFFQIQNYCTFPYEFYMVLIIAKETMYV